MPGSCFPECLSFTPNSGLFTRVRTAGFVCTLMSLQLIRSNPLAGIYGVLGKWTQKESYAAFSYALMVTMVTLANREFIDEHGEDLIARLISCAKTGRERDWETKDEVDNAERKGSRNREKEQSQPTDKQDVTSPAPSSSSASSNATPLLSSSPYHYLSLVLSYLQTLNDAYVREGGESYSRQMQTATQFLFAWQIASSEQYCLLEQIAQAIVRLKDLTELSASGHPQERVTSLLCDAGAARRTARISYGAFSAASLRKKRNSPSAFAWP